jgi:hypothetical protein
MASGKHRFTESSSGNTQVIGLLHRELGPPLSLARKAQRLASYVGAEPPRAGRRVSGGLPLESA